MAWINVKTRELHFKIVYFGPGVSGKTFLLKSIHLLLPTQNRGELLSSVTETERILFFDFQHPQLPEFYGFRVRIHLYTVPGAVLYESTWTTQLKEADGVVFVADSQISKLRENISMLQMLARTILAEGKNFKEFPVVLHYSKRDLPNALALKQLDYYLNSTIKVPRFTTSITKFPGGAEVFESLDAIISLVLFRELRNLAVPKPPSSFKSEGLALLYKLKVTPLPLLSLLLFYELRNLAIPKPKPPSSFKSEEKRLVALLHKLAVAPLPKAQQALKQLLANSFSLPTYLYVLEKHFHIEYLGPLVLQLDKVYSLLVVLLILHAKRGELLKLNADALVVTLCKIYTRNSTNIANLKSPDLPKPSNSFPEANEASSIADFKSDYMLPTLSSDSMSVLKEALLSLTSPQSKETVCRLALEPDYPTLLEFAIEADYYPDDSKKRAYFYFMSEQWTKYLTFDLDVSQLSAYYLAASRAEQKNIIETARRCGRVELVAILSRNYQRLSSMLYTDWELSVEVIAQSGQWELGWRLAKLAPPVFAARLLNDLAGSGWLPEQVEEHLEFHKLTTLASSLSEVEIDSDERSWLLFVQALLDKRYQYEVEIEPSTPPLPFFQQDIELDD
jgi:signal recognition particle receptor subunit beta